MDYIGEHKKAFGVEPICTVLASADVTIAPSTYYAARGRAPSARAVRDEQVRTEISRVHKENYGVYGIRKVHAQLGRDGGVHGRPVARCTVARLMKAAGLRGVSRAKGPRTTLARSGPDSRLHGEIGLVPPVEFEAHYNITTPVRHPAPREIHASIKPGT